MQGRCGGDGGQEAEDGVEACVLECGGGGGEILIEQNLEGFEGQGWGWFEGEIRLFEDLVEACAGVESAGEEFPREEWRLFFGDLRRSGQAGIGNWGG